MPKIPKWAVIATLWVWLALLTVTHYGERSPYSYGWAVIGGTLVNEMMGAIVNGDAWMSYPITMYFYEGAPPTGETQNMALPYHSFAISVIAGLTRSYLFANYFGNWLFAALLAWAAVNAAERFGIGRAATLAALMTVASLPLYVEYLGQPLHYVVATSITFLVVIAVMALDPRDARNPWIAGLATAILPINYDPYVFLATLVIWFLFISRFERWYHYLIYVAIPLAPAWFWRRFVFRLFNGDVSTHLQVTFINPVVNAWVTFAQRPFHNVLQPYLAAHIGLHVAVRQALAMIHWPALVLCIALLIRLRPPIVSRGLWLAVLLPCVYLAEQCATAAWDWELNPRRAIPVILAFAVAWCAVTDRLWSSRGWRVAFIAVTIVCCFLAMADTLTSSPVLSYIHTAQGIRDPPQQAMNYKEERLNKPKTMPELHHDQNPLVWHDLGRARLPPKYRQRWIKAQLFCMLMLAAAFWLASRAKLLPRYTAAAAVAVWLASFVRFL